MIDIENAVEEFNRYVKKYDVDNKRIKLKYIHIKNVVDNSKRIAQKLGLSENQVRLAELIGLLHDIGRFEQVKRFDTFSDKDSKIDHADFGVKILYEERLIRKFISENKYDHIIINAIENHNKLTIKDGLTEEEILYSKIIRDADKLDIFRVINEEPKEAIFWYESFSDNEINKEEFDIFTKKEYMIPYKNVKNNADQILTFYSYIYDFNFIESLKMIKENNYLSDFTKRIKTFFNSKIINEQVNQILDICNQYMDSKISVFEKNVTQKRL